MTKRLASRIEYGARHPVGALFAEPNVDPGRIPGRPDDDNLRGGGGRHARAKAGVYASASCPAGVIAGTDPGGSARSTSNGEKVITLDQPGELVATRIIGFDG